MKVIFTKDSEHGKIDTVKDVADGLAKNLLIKKGFAIQATPENLAILKRKKEKEKAEHNQWEEKTNEMINIVQENTLIINRASQSKVKMQGSLTTEDISKEISEKLGLTIDKKMIKTDKINQFGVNDVTIDFGNGKKAVLTIALTWIGK
jgi:large subunit ribosomal protein L9